LTELVEVRVTLNPGHRAHQPCLQERAPPVDQAALAAHIILRDLANSGHGEASQCRCGLHRQLPEEEVDLVVVWVLALRDPEDFDELGLWPQQEAWGQPGHGPTPSPRPMAVSPSSLSPTAARGAPSDPQPPRQS
ncbi:hypothetical protein MC885_004473, partial [Smutsia gigantea]